MGASGWDYYVPYRRHHRADRDHVEKLADLADSRGIGRYAVLHDADGAPAESTSGASAATDISWSASPAGLGREPDSGSPLSASPDGTALIEGLTCAFTVGIITAWLFVHLTATTGPPDNRGLGDDGCGARGLHRGRRLSPRPRGGGVLALPGCHPSTDPFRTTRAPPHRPPLRRPRRPLRRSLPGQMTNGKPLAPRPPRSPGWSELPAGLRDKVAPTRVASRSSAG